MNGLPGGFGTLLETSGRAQGSDRQTSPRILDSSNGPARLVFESAAGWRHTARINRWLAIVRIQPPAGRAARVIWLLDASTVRWSGGLSPGELYRVVTGLDPEDASTCGSGLTTVTAGDTASWRQAHLGRPESWTPRECASPCAGCARKPGSGRPSTP